MSEDGGNREIKREVRPDLHCCPGPGVGELGLLGQSSEGIFPQNPKSQVCWVPTCEHVPRETPELEIPMPLLEENPPVQLFPTWLTVTEPHRPSFNTILEILPLPAKAHASFAVQDLSPCPPFGAAGSSGQEDHWREPHEESPHCWGLGRTSSNCPCPGFLSRLAGLVLQGTQPKDPSPLPVPCLV